MKSRYDIFQLKDHKFKLFKPRFSSTVTQHFFAERVINQWNALPEDVVSAPSLQCFKERLKRSVPDEQGDNTTK